MQPAISAREVVDRAPIGRFHISLVVLATFVIMLDGYDAVSIGFAAPDLAKALNVPVASFGPIFGSGLLGLLLGSLILSPMADRYGRRAVMLASVVLFGLFTLAPLFDLSFGRLIFYRFVTGLGLGGAMPSIIALATEYMPKRRLALLLNIVLAGFPFGAVAGGFIASRLVAAFGWEVIFVIGGVLPLLLVPVLALCLPDSLQYLLGEPERHSRAKRVLDRIDPVRTVAPGMLSVPVKSPGLLRSVGNLFTGGRSTGTLLLWLANFCTLYILFSINNWLPALMTSAGLPLGQAILGPVLMNLGGVCGGIAMGPLIDRFGPYSILTLGFILGAVFVTLLGSTISTVSTVLLVAFFAGLFIDGVQLSLNALAALFYQPDVRTTGIGWALAIGRFGSVVGPVMGGVLLHANWGSEGLFAFTALPALIGSVAIIVLGRIYGRGPHWVMASPDMVKSVS
jgi:AAHS family 4-hydroxybenzoate transporter-like MFS transporter